MIALDVAYLCRILSLLSISEIIFAAADFFASSFSLTFATISSTACNSFDAQHNGEVSAYSVHHFPICTRHFLKNRGSIWKNDEAMRFLNSLNEDRRLIIGCLMYLKIMKGRIRKIWRAGHTTAFWSNMQWSYRTLRYSRSKNNVC